MEDKILDWLSKHGYPFEMRVARALTGRDFRVTQSAYYLDFETSTPREIDVEARLYAFYESLQNISIAELETYCLIECKSTSNPWVVFKEVRADSWRTEYALGNTNGSRLLYKARHMISDTALHKSASAAGHGVAQAFTDSDRAFAAVMAALKSAEAKIREVIVGDERELIDPLEFPHSYSAVVVPVLAVTAPLFECVLSPDGAIELKTVGSSAITLRYPRLRHDTEKAAVVHIVSESYWPQFMNSVHEYHSALSSALPQMLPEDEAA